MIRAETVAPKAKMMQYFHYDFIKRLFYTHCNRPLYIHNSCAIVSFNKPKHLFSVYSCPTQFALKKAADMIKAVLHSFCVLPLRASVTFVYLHM